MNEREARLLEGILGNIEGTKMFEIPIEEPKRRTREEQVEMMASIFGEHNNFVVRAQNIIDHQFGAEFDFKIDEFALLFGEENFANETAIKMSMIDTVKVFNFAEDHVHTLPHETHYNVQYRFVENSLYPWRTEIMTIMDGHSPLHDALPASRNAKAGDVLPVHVSFRVEKENEYKEVFSELIESREWVLGQSCVSDYGKFSYWKYVAGDQDDPFPLWIKPRVNTRDAS